MTTNRMALVPREATEDMASDGVVAAFQAARNNDAKMPEQAKAVYDAMTYAAPNGGKVSREKVTHAAKAAAALRWPDLGKTVGLDVDVCEDVARAVIEALGLELEE